VDALIVGTGPAGCKTAEIVAKDGFDVLVLEEHSEVGKPVQCTGLVSEKIGKLNEEIIVNRIKKARFCSGNEFFEVESKNPVYVIDREKFDKHLAEKAEDAGAKFNFNTRFIDFKDGKVIAKNGNYQTKILVGADGPDSSVAKKCGIELPENILFATQVCVEAEFDPDTVELWFGNDVAPGLFAWVVPENSSKARIGLITNKNPSVYLEKFLKRRCGRIEIENRIGDMVRYGLIKKSVAEQVLLVGDAACQIKPFSAGGIVYGQVGAGYAGEACVKSLKENNFSKKFLSKNYDEKWKKELEGPIKKGLLFKGIFSKIGSSPFSFKLIKSLGLVKLSNFLDIDFLGKS
jgi:geranylgeranyl reductase family protein